MSPFVPTCVNCDESHHGRTCPYPCTLCKISGFTVDHQFKDCPSIAVHINTHKNSRSTSTPTHAANHVAIPEMTVHERDAIYRQFEDRDALIAQYGEELISTIEQEHPEYWEMGSFHHQF